VTSVLQQTLNRKDVEGAPVQYASWGARLGALALDLLPGASVCAAMTLLAYVTAPASRLRWTFVAVLAVAAIAMVVNRVVLPSIAGWSLGRAVFGIRVVRADGRSCGMSRLLLRELAHLLDTAAAFVGWLWPLRDARHRTFADLLLRTEVHVVDRPKRDARRIAARVLVIATLLCVAGAGLGYQVVYRPERAVDRARSEISEQGPRIVEQMLSYDAESMVEDFAKAQQLVTDAYRPKLIVQQQSVQNAGISNNEYWAVSSAVLSVEADRASMLMALQGQRGANANDLKFITATVRVDFEKADGRWRVGGLTVLKKPLLQGALQ
jgi:Mce-associated membrane protein